MFSEVSHRQSGIEKGKESPPFLCVEITITCTAGEGEGESEVKESVLKFWIFWQQYGKNVVFAGTFGLS